MLRSSYGERVGERLGKKGEMGEYDVGPAYCRICAGEGEVGEGVRRETEAATVLSEGYTRRSGEPTKTSLSNDLSLLLLITVCKSTVIQMVRNISRETFYLSVTQKRRFLIITKLPCEG